MATSRIESVRAAMAAQGVRQKDLAERVGVSVTHMSKLMTGRAPGSRQVWDDIAVELHLGEAETRSWWSAQLTWAQRPNGDWQALEQPLRLVHWVRNRGQHVWRLRIPSERDASFRDGWAWRDVYPHGTNSGPLEDPRLKVAMRLVDEHLSAVLWHLPDELTAPAVEMDPDDSRPAHVQVAEQLRAMVGQLKPGDRLPTNRRLAERFGVSQTTVQRAQLVLRDEGLIKSRGSKAGTYVTGLATTAPPAGTVHLLIGRGSLPEDYWLSAPCPTCTVPVGRPCNTGRDSAPGYRHPARTAAVEELAVHAVAEAARQRLTHAIGNPNRGSL